MKIDKTKLSRDFYKEPITRTCGPTKSDIEYIFSCDPKVEDIREALNTTNWTFYKWANKYGICRHKGKASAELEAKVDYSRLSRDYRIYPLKYREDAPKDDLEYLYNDLHLLCEEISQVFGRGNSEGFARTQLTKHGIKLKDIAIVRDRARATYKAKTGYDYATQNPDVQKQIQNTCLKKYGATSHMKSESFKEANFGITINSPDAINRAKKTRLETNFKKYGVASSSQAHISASSLAILENKQILEALYKDHTYMEISNMLGVSDVTVGSYIRKHGIEVKTTYKESSPERQIKACLPGTVFKTDRTIIAPLEIDMYSEKDKIGIEFNGNYWHSTQKKERLYHQNKSLAAEKAGVFLFHINEYEWEDARTRQALVGRLQNIFNYNPTKIFARKCVIKDVPRKEAYEFLNKYHVQGKARAEVRYGLYYNNELVSLMEFTKVTLNNDCDWELIRFCGKWCTNVIGGASRLFKHFLKNHEVKAVVSYSDFAKTTGNVYKSLGFKYQYLTPPQYVWVNGHEYLSRYQTQRKQLIKRGWMEKCDKRSEAEVMKAHGYNKLYDCGKKVWYYQNS